MIRVTGFCFSPRVCPRLFLFFLAPTGTNFIEQFILLFHVLSNDDEPVCVIKTVHSVGPEKSEPSTHDRTREKDAASVLPNVGRGSITPWWKKWSRWTNGLRWFCATGSFHDSLENRNHLLKWCKYTLLTKTFLSIISSFLCNSLLYFNAVPCVSVKEMGKNSGDTTNDRGFTSKRDFPPLQDGGLTVSNPNFLCYHRQVSVDPIPSPKHWRTYQSEPDPRFGRVCHPAYGENKWTPRDKNSCIHSEKSFKKKNERKIYVKWLERKYKKNRWISTNESVLEEKTYQFWSIIRCIVWKPMSSTDDEKLRVKNFCPSGKKPVDETCKKKKISGVLCFSNKMITGTQNFVRIDKYWTLESIHCYW